MVDAVNQSLRMLSSPPGSRCSDIVIIGDALKYSAYWTAFTARPNEYRPTGGGLLQGIGELARLSKQNTAEALTSMSGAITASFETKIKA